MPVMDEFRQEREALKNESFKKKLEYFVYYYKWHVIITLAVVIFLGTLAHDILTAKDYALYGVFLNSYAQEEPKEAMMTELASLLEIDTEEYIVDIDNTVTVEVAEDNDCVCFPYFAAAECCKCSTCTDSVGCFV